MASVSIREVAERAGVSRATVSRVLNRSTEALVAQPTRDRVRQVAAELGYHPNAVARGLAGKPMNTVGVVMAYILPSVTSDPYLGPVLDGILDSNKRHHQKTVLYTVNDWEEAYADLPTYCDGHCDGLILVIPRSDAALVPALQHRHIPFVVIGDSREDPTISVVDVDNVAIAQEAVAYLLSQGHRRIAALCGNHEFSSSAERLEGYRRAHQQAAISWDETLICPGEYWEWSGEENAYLLMKLPEAQRPTALFCSNGRIAVGAMRALKELQVPVPEAVSVIALSEGPELAYVMPAITAVQMPLRQVGARAIETLLGQAQGNEPLGQKVRLSGELIVRASVAPPAR